MKRWIERIFNTADEELDCDQVRQVVATYVDASVNSAPFDPFFDALRHHLDQCGDCNDIFESLYQAAKLEASGKLPSAADLLSGLAYEYKG